MDRLFLAGLILPRNMQFNYKSCIGFLCEIPHVASLCRAIRIRTALHTYPAFVESCDELHVARSAFSSDLSNNFEE